MERGKVSSEGQRKENERDGWREKDRERWRETETRVEIYLCWKFAGLAEPERGVQMGAPRRPAAAAPRGVVVFKRETSGHLHGGRIRTLRGNNRNTCRPRARQAGVRLVTWCRAQRGGGAVRAILADDRHRLTSSYGARV